eukprot:3267394-Ditylum_brightwellii.AAC.1
MTATLTNPYKGHEICFDVICGELYLFGVVGAQAKKGCEANIEVNSTEINMESFLSNVEDDNMGDLIGSDIETKEDECGGSGDDECRNCCQNVLYLNRNVTDTTTEGKGDVG